MKNDTHLIINLLKQPEKVDDITKRYKKMKKKKKIIVTSGYFDPLHFRHIELIQLAK